MARPLRIEYEGALYHITSRGNARAKIFLGDDDSFLFLETLSKVVSQHAWLCHAYCLMGNHYHLLVETPSPNLSRGMQLLNGIYTQSFNREHKRTGHIFQGRFKAILVEKESHLLELARYIALNPVRAKMVRSARDWPWSSYRATAGLAVTPEFLPVDWILSQFALNRAKAVQAYRQFVRQGRGINVWEALEAGSILGRRTFVEEIRPLLRSSPVDPNVLRRERDAGRPDLQQLFLDAQDKTTRNKRIHEAVREHHYTLQEVGDHLGLHLSTISVIARREAGEHSKVKS